LELRGWVEALNPCGSVAALPSYNLERFQPGLRAATEARFSYLDGPGYRSCQIVNGMMSAERRWLRNSDGASLCSTGCFQGPCGEPDFVRAP